MAAGRRPATPATPPQRRYLQRLLGLHVRHIGAPLGKPAFDDYAEAKCYALARHAPCPRTLREASELIEALEGDRERFRREARGELTEEEREREYAIVELANRPEYANWRRRAGAPLRRRYGFPDPGWLPRLNAEIEAVWARRSYGERLEMERFPDRFRSRLVDPALGVPRGKGKGG